MWRVNHSKIGWTWTNDNGLTSSNYNVCNTLQVLYVLTKFQRLKLNFFFNASKRTGYYHCRQVDCSNHNRNGRQESNNWKCHVKQNGVSAAKLVTVTKTVFYLSVSDINNNGMKIEATRPNWRKTPKDVFPNLIYWLKWRTWQNNCGEAVHAKVHE